MIWLSIDQQIAGMAAMWPNFVVVHREGSSAVVWRGQLRPILQNFEVGIYYRLPLVIEMLDLRNHQPRVVVIDPPLRRRRGDREGDLPHVYRFDDNYTDVFLCLFDPDACEWSPSMSIAETTVQWTIDWLASYEGWRTTGEWTGTGRHLEQGAIERAGSS